MTLSAADRLAKNRTAFSAAFAALPVVAILRGLMPSEAVDVGRALVDAGIGLIEVPMNSPDAATSIGRMVNALGDAAFVGAGTVLTPLEAERVARRGARFAVAPNCDPAVIRAARAEGLVMLPGVFTPSEAFAALAAGADGLKLFPAEGLSPPIVKAMRAVLPKGTLLVAVGGVGAETAGPWRAAGIDGIGVGSALFQPGRTADDVGSRARAVVSAWRAA